MKFKYHTISTLLEYVGKEIEWIDLYGKTRTGVLLGYKRPFLPEACNPYADTVKTKLLCTK